MPLNIIPFFSFSVYLFIYIYLTFQATHRGVFFIFYIYFLGVSKLHEINILFSKKGLRLQIERETNAINRYYKPFALY